MPTAPEVVTPTGQVGSFQRHLSTRTPDGTITPKNFISPTTSRRPRGVLTSTSNILSYTTENDDAAEKKQRRRSKVLVMQRQYESPGTPQDRRRSLPTSGMTNAQVADHYANCIKLSTENKINAKNAFGLHLIDYMAELLKEKKGEMTNFQVASCTLDASAKIYAGRVDAIHAETYKIMGGLGHGDKQKGGEDGAEGEGSQEGTTNKKKKRRHCNTIEANIKNLNCNKIDPGFEVDPFFHKMSAAFDEGGTFGLLLNHLHRRGNSSELILDSRCTMPSSLDDGEHKDQATQTKVDIKDLKDIFSASSDKFESLQICPQFAEFEFTKWNQDGEDTLSTMMNKLASSEQAFDVNAAPEPLEDPMMGGDQFGAPPLADADEFSDDDFGGDMTVGGAGEPSLFVGGEEAKMIRSGCTSASTATSGSASALCLQMSLEPTEYSYFNMDALSTWAGPQHWNFRPRSKALSEANKDAEGNGKKSHSKKPPFRISFDEDVDEKPFSKTKAATTLSKATLAKYNKTSTVLPEDLHYKTDQLLKLFSKTNYIVKRQLGVSGTEVDDGIGGYDYDNPNDCANFCPNTEADDDYDDDVGSGMNDFSAAPSEGSQTLGFSSHNESIFDATMLTGDKLVAQPHKVAKIDITYAKTAKRMDVKRLKTLMWRHLTIEDQEKQERMEEKPESEESQKSEGVAGLKSFKDIYDILPEELSKTMANNLSVPIAFVCLLHLANEKCLKITRKEESEDLVIIQDSY